ncbi:MAG: gamma-glutamyltransferase [Microcella sp.]|uniref:gamma-glutamyltransferase family protein n=1 Tax=Microcella sp. TaxID=1913979 RepID=UPI003315420E
MTSRPGTPAFTPAPAERTRPELRGTFGMAASTHWLATATAQSVLERGGTAVDAAVAAAFVLHVVEPHLNGPGGDLTALVAPAGEHPFVLAGQGAAPARATIEHYRSLGLDEIPGAGPLAAAVPGSVVAWLHLLATRGTWEVRDVLAPALGYARDGHPVHDSVVRVITTVAPLFEEHWPTSAAQWMPEGEIPAPGDLITNEAWAAVLAGLLRAGESAGSRESRVHAAIDGWHRDVGAAIEEFVREPVQHSLGGALPGVMTAADLAAYAPAEEPPLTLTFRGVDVVKAGPWSQGPVLLQALAILDARAARHGGAVLDPSTALGVHTVTEALKLALADRDSWYGDPAHVDVPLDDLLSPSYAAERADLISDTASRRVRPGRPGGRTPWQPPQRPAGDAPAAALPGSGEPTLDRSGRQRGDTCHLDVVDRQGTMISATPSGGWLQSSPTIPSLGFCLGTRLQMAWLDEDAPSRLAPGIRPRSTLSPTMLMRDGRVIEALGTPGGDQQDQWQLLYLLRRIVGGYEPQQAIDAPMFHTDAMVASFEPRTVQPASLTVESRLGEDVIAELRARGHEVTIMGQWSLGRLSCVGVDPERGWFYAAANSRGAQGYAAGR